MPVRPPQLDVPVYQPKDMAQTPPVPVEEPRPLPAQAGFVSKGGAGAYVATSILNGWLKGREVAQQRAMAKAQNQMQGADYVYQTMAKNYNDLLRQGKNQADPEVKKAYQAASEAWQQKVNVMQQYAIPQQEQGKKGAKAKTENWLSHTFGKSGINPQMIAEGSLQVLRSSPPPGLGLTPEDQMNMARAEAAKSETKLADVEAHDATLKLGQEKRQAADRERAETIEKKDPGTWTMEDHAFMDGYNRVKRLDEPASQQFGEEILDKLKSGRQLTDVERNFAYANRMLEGPQVLMRTDAKGIDQMVSYSPDGKVLSAVNLGRHYTPDQVGPAMRLAQMEQNMQYKLYDKALPPDQNETPDQRRQRIYGMVAANQTRNPYLLSSFLTENPIQKEQDMDKVSQAIATVFKNIAGPNAPQPARDKARRAMSNIIFQPGDLNGAGAGLYTFRPQLADPTRQHGYWFGSKEPEYLGGVIGNAAMQKEANEVYNQVAEVLRMKYKMTPLDIQRVLPQWAAPGYTGNAPTNMTPTPAGNDNPLGLEGLQP